MPSYELSKDAEKDLREIAQYTLTEWGNEAFQKYKSGLINKFEAIGKYVIVEHQFSKIFPRLLVTKYRFHFIFYLTKTDGKPIIIGVIHEQRHIVNRLKNRLE